MTEQIVAAQPGTRLVRYDDKDKELYLDAPVIAWFVSLAGNPPAAFTAAGIRYPLTDYEGILNPDETVTLVDDGETYYDIDEAEEAFLGAGD